VPAGANFTLLAMPSSAVAGLGGWRGNFSSLSRSELAARIAPAGPVDLRAVPPLRRDDLTLPLSANGLVRVRAAIETEDGGFRFSPAAGAATGRTAARILLRHHGHGHET
jgi:hypothetical protein